VGDVAPREGIIMPYDSFFFFLGGEEQGATGTVVLGAPLHSERVVMTVCESIDAVPC